MPDKIYTDIGLGVIQLIHINSKTKINLDDVLILQKVTGVLWPLLYTRQAKWAIFYTTENKVPIDC